MKIADVVVSRVQGRWHDPGYPPGDRQARALDLYPEFNQAPLPPPKPIGAPIEQLFLEITTDEGVTGLFGPIDDWEIAPILNSLRPLLIGRDPLATELLHDQMVRLDRHGRSGLLMCAISVVDCALWDLKGKVWNQPVYRLLGGPTRPAVPAYASMLGFSIEPAQAAQTASEYKALGYTAQKWFFRYGPGDGAAGMARNLEMAQAVREAVGPYYELMFDAFMGWDLTYATTMVRLLAPLRPRWLEEPIPPERVSEFRQLREAAGFPIATGEHVYTRWQTKELLVNRAVDVLQNDPDWTGGISEQVKVCALASAFEVPVIAHGHSLLPALHVAAAQSPAVVPRVEFLVRGQASKQFFFRPQYYPENGEIVLPTLPGLGLVLDEAKVERISPIGKQ